MTGLLLLAALHAPAQAAEHRYALVVGANTGDAEDLPLRWAEEDARRVSEVLGRIGGVSAEDSVLLLGPDRAELERVLSSLEQRMADDGERSLLFVYYSGHADSESLHLSGTHLGLGTFLDEVEALPVDLRVVVLDACRAGDALARRGAVPADTFVMSVPEPASEGMAVLTSAAAGEDAQESERLEGGVFTHHLLAGLQGAADTSSDGKVSLAEVYRYAHDRTVLTTTAAPVMQHPSYHFDLRGQSDLVLTTLATSRLTGLLHVAEGGRYVLFRSRDKALVAEFELPTGGALALPGGDYLVSWRLPDRVLQGQVRVDAATDQQLDLAAMEALPVAQAVRRGQTTQRRRAMAASLSSGVARGLLKAWDPQWVSHLGIRLDSTHLSLDLGLRYAHGTADNLYLDMSQHTLGPEVAASRYVDWRALSFGFGVRAGVDWITQRLEGDIGETRGALSPRLGPLLRVELAPGPHWSLGLDLSTDVQVFESQEPLAGSHISLTGVPQAALVLHVYPH